MTRRKRINSYANFRRQASSFYSSARKNVSVRAGIKALANFEKLFNKATKSKNLNYAKLEVFSLSQLRKMGYTDKAIYNKLNNYYRSKGKQLMLDVGDNKSFTKAIRSIKKSKTGANLYSGRVIPKTEKSKEKMAYTILRKVANTTSKDSFANRVLDDYQKGYYNAYQLRSLVSNFTASAGSYFEGEDLNKVTYIIKGYNDDLGELRA